jgi:4-amino-4-deoxy-L-arabinose transferase-like glycosyltransferase
LAWGYYSKPPMVAWLIAGSTAVGGDAEAWVRLPAALVHGVAALAIYGAGARLYGPWTGLLAAALYSLMPGVQLSAGVITTDAPLLMFLSLALLAYTVVQQAPSRRARLAGALGLGAALGLALLSKYAALYFVIGLALHALLSGEARRRWTWPAAGAALAGLVGIVAPNLLWNASHGFSTVSHTAANANWGESRLFNPGELAGFLGEQFAVFGPAPFAALAAGVALIVVRRRLRSEDLGLLVLVLTPLLVVAAQAFISRAHANWAAAAYVPGSVLVAAWLVRWRARWVTIAALGSQAAIAALFLTTAAQPGVADWLGGGNGLKRARGWEATTRGVEQAVAGGTWTAVAADDRFLFNAMAYYGRETFARPGAPPLVMWVREASPQNQAETERPLRPDQAGRVLVASLNAGYRPEMAGDFTAWRPLRMLTVRLDPERTRETALFEASGYRRAPRDPRTGLPVTGLPVTGPRGP